MVTSASRSHWIRWLTIGVLIGWAFAAIGCRSTDRISRTEAITIAHAEARRIGYNFDSVVVEADEGNTGWQAFIRALEKDDPQAVKGVRVAAVLEKLQARTYWAIGISATPSPGFNVFDGAVWIFVDARSGAVIGQLGNRPSKP
jgi:hypothetical protein